MIIHIVTNLGLYLVWELSEKCVLFHLWFKALFIGEQVIQILRIHSI